MPNGTSLWHAVKHSHGMPILFPATRWSLIARLPDQPQQAATLISLYADAIGSYIQIRMHNERPDVIEDIVQEVLTELLAKPDALAKAKPGSGSRFRYYIMHLAWQSAQNVRRYLRRRMHSSIERYADEEQLSLLDTHPHDTPAPDQVASMDRAWAQSVIQQALDDVKQASHNGQLDDKAYDVLHANLIEGDNLREVASKTALSLATCSRRLAQARQFFQQSIAERLRLAGEIGPTDDAIVAGERLISALST